LFDVSLLEEEDMAMRRITWRGKSRILEGFWELLLENLTFLADFIPCNIFF